MGKWNTLSLFAGIVAAARCGAVAAAAARGEPYLPTVLALAPQLEFARRELSEDYLRTAREHGRHGDGAVAWRHLEAAVAFDRGNAMGWRAAVGHHLLQVEAIEAEAATEGLRLPEVADRVDHELDAAFAAVEGAAVDDCTGGP